MHILRQKKLPILIGCAILLLGIGLPLYQLHRHSQDEPKKVIKQGKLVHLSGKVTQVFTDCASSLTLDAQGAVVKDTHVSCDGGSYIVLDGHMQIYTASGYTTAEYQFDKHNSEWKPGDMMKVTAVQEIWAPEYYSLNCPSCGVTSLK